MTAEPVAQRPSPAVARRAPEGSTPAGHSLTRQTAALTAGRAGAAAISVAWLAVAAHELPVSGFGELALVLSLGAMLSVVADPGYTMLVAAWVPRKPAATRSLVAVVLRRRLIAGLVAAALLVGAYAVAAGTGKLVVPLLFTASLLATAVYTTVTAALRGLGTVWPDSINEVSSRLLVLGAGAVWLFRGGGLVAAVATYAAADVLSAIVLLGFFLHRVPPDTERFDRSPLRLAKALPVGVGSVLGTIYYRLDMWLVGLLRSAGTVAMYAAPYRIVDGILLPAGALANLILPHLENHSASRVARARVVMAMAMAGTAAVCVVVGLAASPLLRLLFGAPYTAATGTLDLLLASAPFGAAVLVIGPVVALDHAPRFTGSVVLALLGNVGLNLVLIPMWSAQGAAAANLVSQAMLAAVLIVALGRDQQSAAARPPTTAGPSRPESSASTRLTGIRVLLFSRGFPPLLGGVERQAYLVASSLEVAGADVEVFTTTRGPLRPGRARLHIAPGGSRPMLLYALWVMLASAVARLRHPRRPTVAVVFRMSAECAVLSAIHRMMRVPLVVFLVGGEIAGSEFRLQRRGWLRRRFLRETAAVVAHADLLLDEVRQAGYRGQTVRIMTIADVDADESACVHDPAWTAGTPALAWCGRDDPVKNLPMLLRVAGRPLERGGSLPSLLMIIDQRPDLALNGAALHVACRSPRTHLRHADALLLPSLFEGQSNAMAEAALEGVPTVALATGGTPEAMGLLDGGECVPPDAGDQAFAEAALRVLARFSDPRQRSALAGRARAVFCKQAPDAWAQLMIDVVG